MMRLLLALAATVVLGLASRLYPVGWLFYDRVLGEVLYAVAAYLVLAMLLVRQPPLFIAVIAFVGCLAVELFKLTSIPAGYQRLLLVRWFLGMTFSVVNLGYYFIGVVLIACADCTSRGAKRAEKKPIYARAMPMMPRQTIGVIAHGVTLTGVLAGVIRVAGLLERIVRWAASGSTLPLLHRWVIADQLDLVTFRIAEVQGPPMHPTMIR